MAIKGGHHFNSNYGEETPFYWLFWMGGTVLLGKFRGGVGRFFFVNTSETMLEVG